VEVLSLKQLPQGDEQRQAMSTSGKGITMKVDVTQGQIIEHNN